MDQVICIGSCSKDIFFPTDEGVLIDTPEDIRSQKKIAFEMGAKYQIDDRHEAVGGVAANVAQGLARLGIHPSVYSNIGDDMIGKWIMDILKSAGVGVEKINIIPGCKSDLSAIIVDKNTGDRTIFFNRDANEKMAVKADDLYGNGWIFISALNGRWEENLEIILKYAAENNIPVAFNPGQRNIKDNVKKVAEAIKQCKFIVLNKDEAIEIISSIKGLDDQSMNDETVLIKEMKAMGPDVVLLTDGRNGSWGYDGDRLLRADAAVKNPLETTGAGDAYTSGSFAARILDMPLDEMMKWGIANSGNVVMYYGASQGLLDQKNISEKSKNITVFPIG